MAKRYTEAQMVWLETCLRQDVRDFVPLFGRKPTEDEVIVWAESIYNHKVNGMHNGWAKNLIHRALWGLKVHRNVRKSSFVLYSGAENNVHRNVLRNSIDLEVAIR